MLGTAFIGCSDGGSSGGSDDSGQQGGGGTGGEGGAGGAGGAGSQGGDAVTYAWNFQNVSKTTYVTVDGNKGYFSADLTYASTPAGLDMILLSGEDAQDKKGYNNVDNELTVSSSKQTVIYGKASKGAIEPTGELCTIPKVKGPFKVTAYVSTNSDADKPDRYAYIKVAGEEVVAPSKTDNKLLATGEILEYSYTGTEKVDVIIGCEKIMRIYDVIIESAATQSQYSNFAESTEEVANDIATLGLIGSEATSNDTSIATVAIADGKVKITSKAAGSTTVTVTDANSKTATIAVSVNGAGAVTAAVSAKYAVAKPVKGTEFEVTETTEASPNKGSITAKVDGLEYKTKDGAEYTALTKDTSVDLDLGAYVVRVAAVDGVYAASADSEVFAITEYSVGGPTYTMIDFGAWTAEVKVSKDNPALSVTTTEGLEFKIYGKGCTNVDNDTWDTATSYGKKQSYAKDESTKADLYVLNLQGTMTSTFEADKTPLSCVEFVAPTNSLTVTFYNNKDGGRKINVCGETSGTHEGTVEVSKVTIGSSAYGALKTETYTVVKGEKVQIGSSSSGLYISKIEFN